MWEISISEPIYIFLFSKKKRKEKVAKRDYGDSHIIPILSEPYISHRQSNISILILQNRLPKVRP